MNILDSWKAIDKFWEGFDFARLESAPQGAVQSELDELIVNIEVALPNALIQSLSCHNGDAIYSLLSCDKNAFPLLMSTQQIINKYRFSRETSNKVKSEYPGSLYKVYGEIPSPKEMWPIEWVPFWDFNGDVTGVIVAEGDNIIIGVDVANGIVSHWFDSLEEFFEEIYKSLANHSVFDFDMLMAEK